MEFSEGKRNDDGGDERGVAGESTVAGEKVSLHVILGVRDPKTGHDTIVDQAREW